MTVDSSGRNRLPFALTAAAFVAVAAGVGLGVGRFRQHRETASPPIDSKRGAWLFQTNCANCHGPEGAGDGTSAVFQKPPPRDFAVRPWRFEPTKQSIRRVILEGIPGTAMPAGRGVFTDGDLDALVDHVYLLATSRPTVVSDDSPKKKLLKAGGFVDLHGVEPPPLSLADGSGRTTVLGDLKGKLVLVNFWGTTCIHCLKEMPHLRKMETEFAGRGLIVLHVCADADDAEQAQAMLDRHVPGTRSLIDETGLGLARYEVQSLPTVWLIGADGKAIGRAGGSLDWRSPTMKELIVHFLPRQAK